MKNNDTWFSNIDCPIYPCHKLEEQNCLFCFCPLHHMSNCGGDYTKIIPVYGKDCSKCLKPHDKDSYNFILNGLVNENRNKEDVT